MDTDFFSMVKEKDPKLADLLLDRVEALRKLDLSLVKASEKDLAKLRKQRPQLRPELPDGHTMVELFTADAIPDSKQVEILLETAKESWLVVERLERRQHE